MVLPLVSLRPLSGKRRDALVRRASQAALTYTDVGSTLGDGAGTGGTCVSRTVGFGDEAFARAVQALRTFAPQKAVASVVPEDAEVHEGATVLVVLRLGPLTVVAPDRVVAVVDDADRYAFAYGTLPGHPECGEESFEVVRRPDGSVSGRIIVHALPAVPGGALLAPVERMATRYFARRYLDAIEAEVRGATRAPASP